MGYEKQTMSLPFTQGPDLKSDQRLASKPSRLENSIFTTGDLNKHPGRKALPSAISGGGTQSSGEALFVYGNELTRINGGTTYGLSTVTNAWTAKQGGNNYCTIAKTRLTTNSCAYDYVETLGFGVLAWADGGSILMSVIDIASGTFIQSGTVIASGVTFDVPRCLAMGGSVVILAKEIFSTGILSTVLSLSSPSTAPAAMSNIRNDAYNGAVTFDAFTYGPGVGIVVYVRGAGGSDLGVFAVGPAGTVLASPAIVTVAGVSAGAGLTVGISANRDAAGNIYIVAGDTVANRTRFVVLTSALAVLVAVSDVVISGNWDGFPAAMFVGTSAETSSGRMTFIMTNALTVAGGVETLRLGKVALGPAGVVTAFTEMPSTQGLLVLSGLVPYDGGFAFGAINLAPTNIAFLALGYSGTSAFVLDINAKPIAVALQSASGYRKNPGSSVAHGQQRGAASVFLFGEQGRFEASTSGTSSTVITTAIGVSSIVVTPASAAALPIVSVGHSAYIGGGYPRTLDGKVMVGAGLNGYPIILSVTAAGAVGALSAGTYQWCLVASWLNAQGELVRGPPSIPTSLVVAATNTATITWLTLPESTRDLVAVSQSDKVVVEVYRTQANGTVFYKQSSTFAPTFNGTVLGGTISDAVSDASLASGELLYTTGGVLDWEVPPAYSVACSHQGRLVVIPSEDPYSFWPSSTWVPGETVRFSSFTVGHVPSDTGPITGVASMDGKLVFLTQSAAYVTLGDGPDRLGNNLYPVVQRVVGVDAGPIPGSPVSVIPDGIVYQSVKGLTLLDRSLNQSFMGAEVEPYTIGRWTLRNITIHPRLQQVHFQVDDGRDIPGAMLGDWTTSLGGYRLVWDYQFKQWSVDPAWGAQDATIYQGNYTQVRSDGVCLTETPGYFLDQGSPYSSVVETPWVKLSGVEGFQRLYYVSLLGTYGSDMTLKLEVAYSYSATEPTVPYFDPADAVTLDGAAARAAGAEGFVPGGPFVFRHHLGRKCSAVKFRISDTNIRGDGTGMGLTDLSLEFGIKKGLRKLPAAQTA